MGIGIAAAAGPAGGYETLDKILAQRMQQAALQRQMEQQAFEQQQAAQENDFRRQTLGQNQQRIEMEAQRLNTPEPQKPFTMGPGQNLVDPSTGRIIATMPAAEQAPPRPISLAPGGSLVDPGTGRIIASMPDRPQKPERSMDDILAEYEAKKRIDAQYTGARPSLGAERTALGFFNRMLEAERNARAVEDKVSPTDIAASQYAPGFLENWLKSPEGQQYTQAQRMFTEARLRKESGAAIPEGEFENDRRMNFRSSGDKPETIKQKRSSRLNTMRGIGNTAGRALQEYYGDSATLDDLLKEFAEQEAAAAPTAPASGAPRVRYDINGKRLP